MVESKQRFVPVAAPVIGEREIAYVDDAVRSGWVSSLGPYLERFERGFAEYCGVRHAIAVSNGTAALHLALHTLGLGSGDEVVVPDLTFAATAHAVLQIGATPVLVDVEPDTGCLDPVAFERAISPHTRAVVVVHLYGHPADMDRISAVARAHQIVVIEDAAEAHGARTPAGAHVGSLGVVGAFSFYGNKVMTTGEGGMLCTSDDALCERLRFLKDHGMSPRRRYWHEELAFNYRMTNLQAALGVAQLEQIEDFIARKRTIAGWYRQALGGRHDLELVGERAGYRSVFWMVCAVLADEHRDRDELCRELREQGVDTRPYFVPMSQLPHLSRYRAVGVHGEGCPVALGLSRRGFNLPSGAALGESDVRFCAETLGRLLDRSG
jgi:perosamine synthetase